MKTGQNMWKEFCSRRNGCLAKTFWAVSYLCLVAVALILSVVLGWVVCKYALHQWDPKFPDGDWPFSLTDGMVYFGIGLAVSLACVLVTVGIHNAICCTYVACRHAKRRLVTLDLDETM